ncbi:HTH domain-containing protein [Serratia phage Parlo]|uniref:HTH domain-containing protein n=1 Tax=Serratia phage Parlo TaxID=2557554 RepID=A0A482MG50_9CAUD|nr:HTH domain-containing protein [Serratia phage Parlo]QBQ72179.1 HTH domain-containing protein [Serratia phage Parlo]
MSFQAMTWATEQDLKANEKIVLVMLANRCNHDTGRCDPAHKRLARECGMSLSTLKRCIDKLEGLGLLTVERREVNGVSIPNQYHLHLGVSSQGTYSAQNTMGVGSDLGGGVGSQTAAGSGHSELQNSNYNQEVKPVIKTVPDADKSASVAGGVSVSGAFAKSQQKGEDQNTAFQEKCRLAWHSYSDAYQQRYGVKPVRNARINGQVKTLVKRLGEEAAPVAAFFVLNVSEAFVVRKMHDLGALVSGAEAYRTQWATGSSMTNTRARQVDQSQANYNAADEAKAILRAQRASGGRNAG